VPASDVWSLGCIFADLLCTSKSKVGFGFPDMELIEDSCNPDVMTFFTDNQIALSIRELRSHSTRSMVVTELICGKLLPLLWQGRHEARPTARQVLSMLLGQERVVSPGNDNRRIGALQVQELSFFVPPKRWRISSSRILEMCQRFIVSNECKRTGLSVLWMCLGETVATDAGLARLMLPAYYIAWIHSDLHQNEENTETDTALLVAVFFAAVCVTFSHYIECVQSAVMIARLIARVKYAQSAFCEFAENKEPDTDKILNGWALQVLAGSWRQRTWSLQKRQLYPAYGVRNHKALPVIASLQAVLCESRWKNMSKEWREDDGSYDRSLANFIQMLSNQPCNRGVTPVKKAVKLSKKATLELSNQFAALNGDSEPNPSPNPNPNPSPNPNPTALTRPTRSIWAGSKRQKLPVTGF
jgi:hypothetical protein